MIRIMDEISKEAIAKARRRMKIEDALFTLGVFALIVAGVWVLFNEIGNLPPLVKKAWVHLGG